ncbi:hypothetical protein CAAN3_01S14752 [[Candida] anglica]
MPVTEKQYQDDLKAAIERNISLQDGRTPSRLGGTVCQEPISPSPTPSLTSSSIDQGGGGYDGGTIATNKLQTVTSNDSDEFKFNTGVPQDVVISPSSPSDLDTKDMEIQNRNKQRDVQSRVESNKLRIIKSNSSLKSLDHFENLNGPSMGNKIPRFQNTYLRPNAKFVGEQLSDKSRYPVEVQFKTIDLANSLVTGFLQISGLTEDHPDITTYFKGEIINNPLNKFQWRENIQPRDENINKFSFSTENRQWGSYFKNDLEHWEILTQVRDSTEAQVIQKLHQIQSKDHKNQYIYMRWKEEFLVPDSRVKSINRASFEGFYYIVLNIGDGRVGGNGKANGKGLGNITTTLGTPGSISGLYYYKDSEKFQSLSLGYVKEQGGTSNFQFC